MDTVLITGSNRGIGKALKEAFESRGDKVIGHTRQDIGDLRDMSTIYRLAEIAVMERVNILINCAGVYSQNGMNDLTFDEIKDIIEVDLIAAMMLTRALWSMLVATHGTIININSIAGRQSADGEIAYRAAKSGLTGFSNALFYEGLQDRVRVIDVPFSGVNTDMIKHRPKLHNEWQQPEAAARLVIEILDSQDSSKIDHFLIRGANVIDNRTAITEHRLKEKRRLARQAAREERAEREKAIQEGSPVPRRRRRRRFAHGNS